jgi:hypothetical protein
MFLTHFGNAVEGGTTSVAQLHHQRNQPTHMTDGVKVTHFCYLQNKTRAATDHLYQIVLNQKVV